MINSIEKSRTTRDFDTLTYATVKAYQHESFGLQKIWAVATDSKNRIIVEAGNNYICTSSLQRKYASHMHRFEKCFSHAEISVLSKLIKSGKHCDKLFIARSDRQGRKMLSRPCPLCAQAISDLKIRKIYWTISHSDH